MDNTDNILKQLGTSIIKTARKYLKARKKDKRSSGKLNRSMKQRVSDNELIIVGEDYAEFVDQGTKNSTDC